MNPQPGDYACVTIPFLRKKVFGLSVLVPNVFGYAIRLFTRSRYDHAFLYIGNDQIIESRRKGAVISDLSIYDSKKMLWNSDTLSDSTRQRIVKKADQLLGTPYGWLDLVYLGLAILGFKWDWLLAQVERQDRLICSQLVAVCGQSAGLKSWLCGKTDPCLVTPADLASRISRKA